ncbi:MAG: DUF5020 family protein, partial [Candidatus Lokiarchaeota archaeon]|nr:DUF5020 family protein [Candidatus Lokiarchaeota archaeon]
MKLLKKIKTDFNINLFFTATFGFIIDAMLPTAINLSNLTFTLSTITFLPICFLMAAFIVVFVSNNKQSIKDLLKNKRKFPKFDRIIYKLGKTLTAPGSTIDVIAYTIIFVPTINVIKLLILTNPITISIILGLLVCYLIAGAMFVIKHLIDFVLEKIPQINLKLKPVLRIFIILILFSLTAVKVNGQNIQYQYNSQGNHFVTFEHLKFQKHGKFFYFSDFTLTEKGNTSSYTEIFQYYRGFTIQYNFGISEAQVINPVYLVGVSKDFTIEKFNCSIDLLYRYTNSFSDENNLVKNSPHNYQLSLGYNREGDKFQINGFVDYWNLNSFILN